MFYIFVFAGESRLVTVGPFELASTADAFLETHLSHVPAFRRFVPNATERGSVDRFYRPDSVADGSNLVAGSLNR